MDGSVGLEKMMIVVRHVLTYQSRNDNYALQCRSFRKALGKTAVERFSNPVDIL